MNRFVWSSENLQSGEVILRQQPGVALYDGERKTPFVGGELVLTSHQVYWTGPEKQRISLHLSLIILIEEQSGSWSKRYGCCGNPVCGVTNVLAHHSAKIVVHVSPPTDEKHAGVVQSSPFDYVRFSFRSGGSSEFYQEMQAALQRKDWLKMPTVDSRGKKIRTGIVGIERQIQAKHDEADKNISAAFEDLSKLMEMAKDMVALSKSITQKLKEKGSSLTDDETIMFKSHLLSLGISDPVTKSAYGSGINYYQELAKQLAEVLEGPVQESGGIISLTDVYCRINRARGLELLSPEDLLNACKVMESLQLPLRLHVFGSGVTVLKLATQNDEKTSAETRQLIDEHGSLSAEQLSPLIHISVILAKERLICAEQKGLVCRDDSVEGLSFYPNLFLEKVD
ncbi:vacuolar protein-sorting-associated protein 36 isoform X1 [Dermacentor silvarum]|uniref:vacuolar protein-sorting-associated protein 36 isoform X1 n=1 Tax=Dermacentor silvarum TaxID=543639 RepID=UPI002100A1E7|nr:vacuolar protein-sorting-associated protein 36 isoform X1 [Dermacentor silvarum]